MHSLEGRKDDAGKRGLISAEMGTLTVVKVLPAGRRPTYFALVRMTRASTREFTVSALPNNPKRGTRRRVVARAACSPQQACPILAKDLSMYLGSPASATQTFSDLDLSLPGKDDWYSSRRPWGNPLGPLTGETGLEQWQEEGYVSSLSCHRILHACNSFSK